MRAYLKPEVQHLLPEIQYLFGIFSINKKTTIQLTTTENLFDFSIGLDSTATVQVPANLTIESLQQEFSNQRISSQNMHPSLAKVLYLINAVQEYGNKDTDALGRFRYANSYQHRENCAEQNLVQEQFDSIAKLLHLTPIHQQTRFCLTHDMDSVYGSIYEDGLNVIKRGRFDIFLRMLVKVAIGKPEWLNVDQILKLESAYDCKSIFFWIMEKGNYSRHLKDADYTFHSKRIQTHFKEVASSGSDNALHKSVSSHSFSEEIKKYGTHPTSNRYHYLKFNLPLGYDAVAEANLKIDFSLGFSEKMGFRNSYGLPFTPYNFSQRKPYSFLEVPLHVMDRTFFQYEKSQPLEVKRAVIDFFENHRNNCVLSVLWHNNFFSEYKYKGYLSVYKDILIYIKENNFKTISQEELLTNYSLVQADNYTQSKA